MERISGERDFSDAEGTCSQGLHCGVGWLRGGRKTFCGLITTVFGISCDTSGLIWAL